MKILRMISRTLFLTAAIAAGSAFAVIDGSGGGGESGGSTSSGSYISVLDTGYWLIVTAHKPAINGSCHFGQLDGYVSLRVFSQGYVYDSMSDWNPMTLNGAYCEFTRAYAGVYGNGPMTAGLYLNDTSNWIFPILQQGIGTY